MCATINVAMHIQRLFKLTIIATIISGCTTLCTPALAKALIKPPPAKQAQIDQLFKLLGVNSEINKSWNRVKKSLGRTIFRSVYTEPSESKLTPSERYENAKTKTDKIVGILDKNFKAKYKSDMRNIYTHVYSKYYTSKDLATLITFYKSDTFKKAKLKNPVIIKSSTLKLVRKLRPKLEKKLKEKLLEKNPKGASK